MSLTVPAKTTPPIPRPPSGAHGPKKPSAKPIEKEFLTPLINKIGFDIFSKIPLEPHPENFITMPNFTEITIRPKQMPKSELRGTLKIGDEGFVDFVLIKYTITSSRTTATKAPKITPYVRAILQYTQNATSLSTQKKYLKMYDFKLTSGSIGEKQEKIIVKDNLISFLQNKMFVLTDSEGKYLALQNITDNHPQLKYVEPITSAEVKAASPHTPPAPSAPEIAHTPPQKPAGDSDQPQPAEAGPTIAVEVLAAAPHLPPAPSAPEIAHTPPQKPAGDSDQPQPAEAGPAIAVEVKIATDTPTDSSALKTPATTNDVAPPSGPKASDTQASIRTTALGGPLSNQTTERSHLDDDDWAIL